MKALFINNYEMREAWDLWKSGTYPGHHLWGVSHLGEYGVDVEILPHEKFAALNDHWRFQRLLNMNRLETLALDQQLRVLLRSGYDLVYSGCQTHTSLLARLRALGIFRKPLVAVIHHPVQATAENERFVKAHDKLICLSKKVEDKLKNDFSIPDGKSITLEWGADLAFYDAGRAWDGNSAAEDPPLVVSAGKAKRDYNTLVESARNLDCRVQIYCSESSAPSVADMPDNVQARYGPKGSNAVSYREVLQEYKKAHLIAIPMAEVDALAGLTSLLDAMAMGKAVVMTRNDYIDIDIEKEGIGIWVAPGDVNQWRTAISYLLSHPGEAMEMGRRSRLLCEEKYDIRLFASKLADVFRDVLSPKQREKRPTR
ncbi:MAG: glycosyltransferase family 4 protein [Pseudomonadota bacterium]